jgi:predicted transcriptional regulator
VATSDPIELAAEILTAFVSRNSVPRAELAALFEGLHAALKRLADGGEVAPAAIDPPAPAVSIRKSVTPDYLICLEDGKRFKSLRRHLATLGMTPEQYRAKWNLPSTYPMVASNYAAQRSALAKNIGFGQLRKKPVAVVPVRADESEVVAAVPASADTIEVAAPEPANVAKSNAKVKARSKVVASPPAARVKRKSGRPRKVTT